MYVLALLRYRRPLEEVVKVTDAHRAYLRELKEKGTLLASGPFDPRVGGALLLRFPDGTDLKTIDAVPANDPFFQQGLAQYEILPWNPVIGGDALDRI